MPTKKQWKLATGVKVLSALQAETDSWIILAKRTIMVSVQLAADGPESAMDGGIEHFKICLFKARG